MDLEKFTPRVSKRILLFTAASIWGFAGSMLLMKGHAMNATMPVWSYLLCIIGGLVFFKLMFDRISTKHIHRIKNLPHNRPCFFSFFNIRSYILMISMITFGITLRHTGFIAPEYLSLLYITMGTPLLLSSFRFFYSFFRFTSQ